MYEEDYFDLFVEEVKPNEEFVKNRFYYLYTDGTKEELQDFVNGYKKYYNEKSKEKEKIEIFAKALAKETWEKFKKKAKELGADEYDIDEAFTHYLNDYVY